MLRNSKLLLRKPQIVSVSFYPFSNEIQQSPTKQGPVKEDLIENKSEKKVVSKDDVKSLTKQDLKWRTPWHETEGKHYSFLRTFYKEETSLSLTKKWLGSPDFTPAGIKKWWNDRYEEAHVMLHSYDPERNRILGDELAAAHFVVSRGGAVKFVDEDRWIKADERGNYSIPRLYEDGKYVEAIDCLDMEIVYESLSNFRNLQKVKWLSLNGCKYMDDWCLDAVANIFSETVVYLDLRNLEKISFRGLGALAKMNNLKILYIDDFYRATTFELTCLLLEEFNTSLQIKSDKVTFEIPP